MKMNEPSRWEHVEATGHAEFDRLISTAQAVEVGHRAPKWLAHARVAIDVDVFDRFVEWDTEALRRHMIALDERTRLEHVFDACGCAAFGAGGCFICKAVDARGYSRQAQRHVLTITNYGRPTSPLWLIHG